MIISLFLAFLHKHLDLINLLVLLRNGGVCLYNRENLPIKERSGLEILDETIIAEIKIKRKKIFFVFSYRHPNQTLYMQNLEHISDITNWEGRIFTDFLQSSNLEELRNGPTYIRDDQTEPCIDLICSDQPCMFTEIGVVSSLDSHSKHNIVYGKLNFKFPSPPPHRRNLILPGTR